MWSSVLCYSRSIEAFKEVSSVSSPRMKAEIYDLHPGLIRSIAAGYFVVIVEECLWRIIEGDVVRCALYDAFMQRPIKARNRAL
jgi:hypothetical protein